MRLLAEEERASAKMMRAAASQFRTYLSRGNCPKLQSRNFSSYGKDELSVEEDAERKIGWLLKLIFAGTAGAVGYHFFPYMGDTLLQQSISLLQVKDPFFRRTGASRVARFAVDDEKRMKIVELGGAQQLVTMLVDAKDDKTRIAALKALAAISQSDMAVGALHNAGAVGIIKSIPESVEEEGIKNYKSTLLRRFQDMKYDC